MYYLVLWLLVLNGCEPQQRIERPNSMVRSHLEAVAQSLPKGSSMRQTLLAGKTGSGERETWMERTSGITQIRPVKVTSKPANGEGSGH